MRKIVFLLVTTLLFTYVNASFFTPSPFLNECERNPCSGCFPSNELCTNFDTNFCDSQTLPAAAPVSILPLFINQDTRPFLSKAFIIKNLQENIDYYLENSGINHKLNLCHQFL